MQRTLPSEAALVIAETYPFVLTVPPTGVSLRIDQVIKVGALVATVDGIPEELLPTGNERTRLITALGAMRAAVARWASGGHEGFSPALDAMPAIGGHPITVAYQVLAACPDEAPSVSELELTFITDDDARRSIRTDMSNAERAIGNGEWKAATVLAGSVVEALLLWAVTQHSEPQRKAAAVKWHAAGEPPYNRCVEKDPPVEWHIRDFIEIAYYLGEITDATRKAARLAGEYRNLIHPGRVLRIGADATHGTALLATGAMREVAREITETHP